jgi:hypothetical protein
MRWWKYASGGGFVGRNSTGQSEDNRSRADVAKSAFSPEKIVVEAEK